MPSQKILQTKQKVVSNLVEDYKAAQAFVFVDARGLTVLEDTQMRASLRKNGVNYKVVKNATASRVFEALGYEGLDEIFKGPTAIAYSTEDLIAPAKSIKEYADKFDHLTIKGGIIENKVASIDEVNKLASVPTKEVLCGQLAYGLLFPLTKLAMLLKATAEKLQEEGEAPVEDAKEEKTEEKVEAVEESKKDEVESTEAATEDVAEESKESAE